MSTDHLLSGRPYRDARARFRRDCEQRDAPCWICRQGIDYRLKRPDPDAWELDHLYPRSTHPELVMDPGNFRPSHARCNQHRGNRMVDDDLGTPSRTWTRSTP